MIQKNTLAIARQPLVDTVIDVLRKQIADQNWKVGERIPTETELTEMFAVGRNTVREAIRVLSHSGMLEVRQGDGTYVRSQIDPSETMRQMDKGSLQEHFELQCMLESEAARYAAERRTQSDLNKIRRALEARGENSVDRDIESFLKKDAVFHQAIVNASHNMAMIALYEYFRVSVRQNTRKILLMNELPEPGYSAHLTLVEAIEQQDAMKAQEAVRKMLQPMIDYLADA